MWYCLQVHGDFRVRVLAVLLLPPVQHVGRTAVRAVLRLHAAGLLRVLAHAGYRVILRLAQIHPLHLRQPEDGLAASI